MFQLRCHCLYSLLSVAYATTAAFGGLLTFALFTLYPTFMGYMAGIFKDVMFIYALLFFAETFALYLYYYGWDWLNSTRVLDNKVVFACRVLGILILIAGAALFFGAFGPEEMRGDTRAFMVFLYFLPAGVGLLIIKDVKSTHILIGIILNIVGTGIMMMANSMAGFMMSPAGVDEKGILDGTVWEAFENVLATSRPGMTPPASLAASSALVRLTPSVGIKGSRRSLVGNQRS